jgi:hypothetical protein
LTPSRSHDAVATTSLILLAYLIAIGIGFYWPGADANEFAETLRRRAGGPQR